MQFNFDGKTPLFQQVADEILEGIFNGSYEENTQIPSTTEISKSYKINPATILKGMNRLVAEGLIEKKRGLGMFVVSGAQQKILEYRKKKFFNQEIYRFLEETEKLGITKQQLIDFIEKEYHHDS